jgi:hypothetical protein
MGGQDISRANTESPTPNRGLALLNTIFASASSPALSNAITPEPLLSTSSGFPLPPSTHLSNAQPILSSKPTPQILTPDVISSLLGMTPSASPAPASPSSSTALSSSSSRRSGQYQYRYEGDNEDEASDESDRGFSASESATSTVLDFDADNNLELQAAGASAGIPLLSIPGQANGLGDRTPRPPCGMALEETDLKNNIRTSTPPRPEFSPARARMRTQDQYQPSPIPTSQSRLQMPSAFIGPSSSLSPHEDLTPMLVKSASSSTIKADFNPKPPTRSLIPFTADSELWPYPRTPVDDRSHSADNEAVMELDFADTSALSNPSVFQEREQAGKNAKGTAKKDSKKKSKKERAEESERDRDKIEKSWDIPVPAPPSPPPLMTNGKGKTPVKASTLPLANEPDAYVDQDIVKASIISTLSSHNANMAGMSRNAFVMDLLTLIHVSFETNMEVISTSP